MDYLKALRQQTDPNLWGLVLRLGDIAAERNSPLFLVGGRVRDLMLGMTSADLDLVVEGDAIGFVRALALERGGEVVVHPRFGTATYREGDLTFDLATARTEEYSRPGALPDVRPGPLEEDLARRDFTVNAMAVSLSPPNTGELTDQFGGQEDAREGLIRVLHDGSFIDDPTRIMRAIRYEQRLGFRIEPDTLSLLERDLHLLPHVGVDRIRRDVELFLLEPAPERPLERADVLGVLSTIDGDLRCDPHMPELFKSAREQLSEVEPAVYLSLLLYPAETDWATLFLERYRFPKESIQTVRDTLALRDSEEAIGGSGLSGSQVYAHFEGSRQESVQAYILATSNNSAKDRAIDYFDRLSHVRTALSGKDLMDLGVRRGPGVGEMLRRLLDARLDDEVGTREGEENLVSGWLVEDRG